MNKFKIGDTVKFSNDFLNTYTDIIARDMNIPSSVIEYVKKNYFNQPTRIVVTKVGNDNFVKIDSLVDNANIDRWWWNTKWLDFFGCQEIHIDQKEVIKLI